MLGREAQAFRLQGQGQTAGDASPQAVAGQLQGRPIRFAQQVLGKTAEEFHPDLVLGALGPAVSLVQFLMGQVMAVALHLLAGMGQVSAKQAVSGAAIDGVTVEDAFRQARRLFEGIPGDGQLQGLIEDLGILRPALKDPLHEGAGEGEVALVPVMAEQQ